MVWASVGITNNIAAEGLYLYDWEETKIDEPGTYFSSADFVGDGGFKLLTGYGRVADGGKCFGLRYVSLRPPRPQRGSRRSGTVRRGGKSAGTRALNDAEFGFYYLRYHARLPTLSVRTGTAEGLANAASGAAAVYAQAGVTPGTVAAVDSAAQAWPWTPILNPEGTTPNMWKTSIYTG